MECFERIASSQSGRCLYHHHLDCSGLFALIFSFSAVSTFSSWFFTMQAEMHHFLHLLNRLFLHHNPSCPSYFDCWGLSKSNNQALLPGSQKSPCDRHLCIIQVSIFMKEISFLRRRQIQFLPLLHLDSTLSCQ